MTLVALSLSPPDPGRLKSAILYWNYGQQLKITETAVYVQIISVLAVTFQWPEVKLTHSGRRLTKMMRGCHPRGSVGNRRLHWLEGVVQTRHGVVLTSM